MDSITQAALGALCGELTLRPVIGRRGMLWGAIFGTLPDLDVVASPWLDAAGRLAFHRGISHSLLIMVVAALLLGPLLASFHRRRGLSWRRAALFVFLAWSTHVLIDCFTVYGTQIFAPFSDMRVSFDNLFIIDFFFTLPMLLGLFWALILRERQGLPRYLAWGVAAWLGLYTLLSFGMRAWAWHAFHLDLAKRGIRAERMMVAPTLSNVFLWRMLADDGLGNYWIAYRTPWDRQGEASFSCLSKGSEHLGLQAESRDLKTLKWFSKGWWVARRDAQGDLILADLRFGELRVGQRDRFMLIPTFQWRMVNLDGALVMTDDGPRRPETDMEIVFDLFWRRLQGQVDGYLDGDWWIGGLSDSGPAAISGPAHGRSAR